MLAGWPGGSPRPARPAGSFSPRGPRPPPSSVWRRRAGVSAHRGEVKVTGRGTHLTSPRVAVLVLLCEAFVSCPSVCLYGRLLALSTPLICTTFYFPSCLCYSIYLLFSIFFICLLFSLLLSFYCLMLLSPVCCFSVILSCIMHSFDLFYLLFSFFLGFCYSIYLFFFVFSIYVYSCLLFSFYFHFPF